jgi:hypothetical protein
MGASKPLTAAPSPPRNTRRRAGSLTSWMLGLDERLLSSIDEKSLAIACFLCCSQNLRAWIAVMTAT